MSTILLPIEPSALQHVIAHMRPWDRKEIFATRAGGDDALASDIMRVGGDGRIAWVDSEPVAAIGASLMWPGVWSPWCFGTDKFHEASLLLTRHAKRSIIPGLRAAGAHRLQVKSIEGHHDAQDWLMRCFGCHLEATHPKLGRNGETFHTFVLFL